MSNNNKSIRIKTNPGDLTERYVNIQLNQTFDTLDVLSLTLSQKDIYRLFDADYGVVVGRVIGNEGVGLPNCKVSIFIPIDENDKLNPEIYSMYPYEKVTDENGEGIRYNLLHKYGRNNSFNGFPDNAYGIGATPKTGLGNFPVKEELLMNQNHLYIYQKYYKYTALTNESGDFMIYGVPTGQHTIHMDCDLTDIGRWSMHPSIMSKILGFPKSLFSNNGNKIKKTKDLSNSPNIQSQNVQINVRPLWSQDPNSNEIGITRQDFKIKGNIVPNVKIFGAGFTMGKDAWYYDKVLFRMYMGLRDLCIGDCTGLPTSSSTLVFCMRLNLPIVGGVWLIGEDACESTWIATGEPDNFVRFCIKFRNIIPFINVKTLVQRVDVINGGIYDEPYINFTWLGKNTNPNANNCFLSKDSDNSSEFVSNSVDYTNKMDLNYHRKGVIKLDMYTYNTDEFNTISKSGNYFITSSDVDYEKDIRKLNEEEFVYDNSIDGIFNLIIPCNAKKVITDESGQIVESTDPSIGIFSQFIGYGIFSMDLDLVNPQNKVDTDRVRIKVPSNTSIYTDTTNNILNEQWVKQAYIFEYGEIYSVSQRLFNRASVASETLFEGQIGLVVDSELINTSYSPTVKQKISIPHTVVNPNTLSKDFGKVGSAQHPWLNFCLYFLQYGYKLKRKPEDNKVSTTIISNPKTQLQDNIDVIGGSETSTKGILNAVNYQTTFIKVNKSDFVKMYEKDSLGFTNQTVIPLLGESEYKKGATYYHFYKGFINRDSILATVDKEIV